MSAGPGGPHAGGPHAGNPHTGGPHTGGPHTGGPYAGGPYAGAVTRLAAYVVDHVSASALFAGGAAVAAFLTRVVTGRHLSLSGDRDVAGVALALWWFAYFAVSWAVTGATLGMALLGIRVVGADRSAAGTRRAVVRALAFPLSVALFGLGFLGILFHARRRALHDLIAGTVVVYAAAPGPEA